MDFSYTNHGSVITLTPLTDEGRAWCNEHLPVDAQRWGRGGYVIEPRYFAAIHEGISNDGLSI